MNLLLVLHNWVGFDPHGGTELHVRDYARLLVGGANPEIENVYALFPEVTPSAPQCVYRLRNLKNDSKETDERFVLKSPVPWESFRHDECAALFQQILRDKQIGLVHFFHLLRFPLSLPLVAQQSGVPVVLSLFDHYTLCQEFNLLRDGKTFCGHPDIAAETCDLCLKSMYGYAFGSQANRRRLMSEVMAHTDAIQYLCNDQRDRTLATYPHLDGKAEGTQGLGIRDNSVRAEPLTVSDDGPLQVAVIGNITRHKGGDLLLSTLNYFRHVGGMQFHLFGRQLPPYQQALEKFVKESGSEKTLQLYGPYTPDALPGLLKDAGVDIALFASIWPETFVLALSEAWECGLVPVCPRLGAFADRIQHGVNGFLYEPDDPGSVLAVLKELAADRSRIARCADGLRATQYPTLSDNVALYRSLYAEAFAHYAEASQSAKALARRNPQNDPVTYLVKELPVLQSGGVPGIPAPTTAVYPAAARRHVLIRAWGVLRNKGLRWTIYTSVQQIRQRLGK